VTHSDYRPIACSLHDELLAAATKRAVRTIEYSDDQDATHEVVTTIDDVFTRGTEEFARLGSGETVRLDRLVRVEGTGIGDQ
jgi:Rho-binding antiterminator